jgi:hypothetical protein
MYEGMSVIAITDVLEKVGDGNGSRFFKKVNFDIAERSFHDHGAGLGRQSDQQGQSKTEQERAQVSVERILAHELQTR